MEQLKAIFACPSSLYFASIDKLLCFQNANKHKKQELWERSIITLLLKFRVLQFLYILNS